MEPDHLIRLAEAYSAHTGLAEATISNKCAGQARLFTRLRTKQGCSVRTAVKVVRWFVVNWPADLAWPAEVPRPKVARAPTTAGARP